MRSAILLAALAAGLALAVPARADDGGTGDGDGKKPKHKVTQSDSYLMIDPIYSAIMEDERPVGMLMVGVGIDVPDPKLRDEATHAMPVIRDAFVRSLMSYGATAVRSWRQPDVLQIADRLQRVTDRALGRKGARVLLAQVAIHLTK